MVLNFRKKPIVIQAFQWQGGDQRPLVEFVGTQNWTRADAVNVPWTHADDKEEMVVWNEPKKAWVPCPVGWWIIKGVAGEFYPCKPDIFRATYEPVE